MAWHKADECSRRLANIPGIGPIGATLLLLKTPAPEMFRSGRQFAAWIGLTPKDHSTAGKVRLGVITRAGDEALRSVLVVGATAVIQHVRRGGRGSPWIVGLLKRKHELAMEEGLIHLLLEHLAHPFYISKALPFAIESNWGHAGMGNLAHE